MSSELAAPWPVPNHWKVTTMGEACEVVGGSTPKSKEPRFWGGDISWLGVSDLTGYQGQWIGGGARSITQEGYDSCGTALMPRGTVLFSSRAPIGYVAIADGPICTSQGFKSFVPPAGIVSEFLYWYLRALTPTARSSASGTTFPELSTRAAKQLPLVIPPLDEQRAIVAAIEDAFARIDAIEAELRAVHTSRASFKAAVLRDAFSGALISQLPAGGGMSGETDTRDQDFPEGWEWKRLGDVVEVKSGVGFPKHLQGRSAGAVPFAKVSDLSTACREHNGRLVVANNLISEDEVRQLRAPVLPAGAVVMAKIGEAVKLNRRAILSREMTIDNNVMAWIPNTALLIPNYLYCWSLGVRLEDLARATTVPSVRKSSVVELQIPVPPLDEQRAIVAAIEDAFARIDVVDAEATAAEAGMDALRASILHRAFTGELSLAYTSEKEGVA